MPYRLDEKTHKIYIDAPSATTIVNEIYPFDTKAIPKKYLKMGQDRGTHVHKMIETYIKTGKVVKCCRVKTHADQFNYLKKWWDEWSKDKKIDFKRNELIMYDDQFDYSPYEMTGIADMVIGYLDNADIYHIDVVDWKTTKEKHKEKEAIQLWIYKTLFEDTHGKGVVKGSCIVVNSNVKDWYCLTDEEIEKGKEDALKGLKKYYERKKIEEIWD